MRTILAIAVLLTAAALPCAAREAAPSDELAKFDLLLGNWAGEGTMVPSEGGPEIPWTSVSTVTPVLDGFFIQEDARLDFGETAPAPLVFRTVYGFDEQRSRYTYFTLSNAGGSSRGNVFWTADGKLVGTSTVMEQGVPVSYYTVSEFAKDRYTFTIEKAEGGGDFFVHVRASFKRGESFYSAETEKEAFVPVPDEMGKVKLMLGSWSIKGSIHPVPGGPAMKISGREEIVPILGGHVQMCRIQGDPFPGMEKAFQGRAYLVWEEQDGSFLNYSLSSMGRAMEERGAVLAGNRIVFTSSVVEKGIPTTERCVVEIDGDRKTMKIRGDRCAGAEEADISYQTILTRVAE